MREILYKNLTNTDNRKRDLCIREVVEKDGITARIEKRCVYFVREIICIKDPSDVECLKGLKETNDAWKKRHFHVLRKHNSDTGEDKLTCKIAGTLYAIIGRYVFCVAFIHSLKIDLSALTTGNTMT
ncbi:MAG: hypothetical protein PHI59_08800 [Candidatus Omnitrophica bacterium]|nr:hypothetical protein [Candidatus Omnitrophota bacterium]